MSRAFVVIGILVCCSFIPAVEAREHMTSGPASTLSIEWRFDHPPALVWRAWTDPEWIAGWVGSDPKGTVLNVRTDVRPGGHFEFTFADSDGTVHTARGVYGTVDPQRRLTFSWGWASEAGIETSITVALSADGTGTLMHFDHSGLGHATSHDYGVGWRSTFKKVQQLIERQARMAESETRL